MFLKPGYTFQIQKKVFHNTGLIFSHCLITLVPVKRVLYILVAVTIAISSFVYGQVPCLDSLKSFTSIDSSIRKLENCLSGPIHDTASYIRSSCYLTTLYNKKSHYVKSEKILFTLIPLIKIPKNKKLLGEVYNHMANTYKLSRNLATSLQYYLKTIELFESENDKSNLAKCYTDVAEYYRSLGHYHDATNYIRKAITLYYNSGINDIPKLIRIYNRYAAIENENNILDSSVFFSLKSLELARQINDKNSEAVSLNEIGFSLKNRSMIDSAMKCYKKAVELWTETGADADAIHGIFNQAQLLSHNSFPKLQIIPYYEKIIRMVKQKNIDYPLDQVYFELSNCYFFMGDSLNCFRIRQDYYKAILEKNQKIFDAEVNNIQEKYENEKYKQQITLVSGELKETEKDLVQKKRENLIIYILLAVLVALLVVIVLLTRRIYHTNKILNQKNKEKDTLIQEIHHRVKNNLQFVSSLINMQIHSSKSTPEIDSLNDASRRIRSMALVHEMLYNQDNMDSVEINKYLNELVSSINDIVNSKNIPISFSINSDELMFDSPKAIAIGMITSELVSNSIKYAFSGTKEPRIIIDLHKNDEDKITFSVHDNGKGIPDKISSSPEKLGMRLINIFSRQIKGEYTFKNANGLVYTLIFQNTTRNEKS